MSGSELSRRTLDQLRATISSGAWPVGGRIPTEPELMAHLGVGKSTLREAVHSLIAFGMLEPIKGVGTFVRSRTPVSGLSELLVPDFGLAEVLAYRRALEVEAAQHAAMNRTEADLDALRLAHAADVAGPGLADGSARLPGPFHRAIVDAAGLRLLADAYAGVIGGLRRAPRVSPSLAAIDTPGRHADHESILDAIAASDASRAGAAMAAHTARDLWIVPANKT